MAQTHPVREARSASSVPQTGAKAQDAQSTAKADTRAFANMLQEETLANATKARSATAHSSKSVLPEAKSAHDEDGAAASDSTKTDQAQAVAAGFALLAAAPVLAALNAAKGDAADTSGRNGASATLDVSAPKSASQAEKGPVREKTVLLPKQEPWQSGSSRKDAAFSSTLAADSSTSKRDIEPTASNAPQKGGGVAPREPSPVQASQPVSRASITAESAALSGDGKADALPPVSSTDAGSQKPSSVSAVLVSSRTHLAPGPALSIQGDTDDMAAAASNSSGRDLKASAAAASRSETAALERSAAARQPIAASGLDAARADGSLAPETGVSASIARQTGASGLAQIMDPSLAASQTKTSQPLQAAASTRSRPETTLDGRSDTAAASAAGETKASSPLSAAGSAQSRQKTTQDGGSNEERSSGKDRPAAAARSPLEAEFVIPVGAGSVSALTPSQQIAQAIEAAMPQAAKTGAQADATPASSASLQPVKTIALALSPQNLGGVEIELALTGGKLDVKIRAAEPETAKLLRRDDGALEKLLQSAGLSLQGLTIQVSQQAAQSFQTGAQTASSGQAFTDSSASNGGRDQGGRQGGGEKSSDRGSDQGSTNGRVSTNRRGGSLYL
jgi:hypothetical protein